MSDLIFGVFDTRDQAIEAIDAIEGETNDQISAVVHEGHMRDDDVQMAGTEVYSGAMVGALVVGVAASLLGGLLLTPAAGLSLGWIEFALIGGAGTILGITGGAVAGASEPRRELREMAKLLQDGKVMVTMMAGDVPTPLALSLFESKGALQVKTA